MKHNHKGFSLVEIMVGLAIGMIAMLVVMQVFHMSEGQKRTTTSGADTQTNGATALYMIERDTRMVGWGMDPSSAANCKDTFAYCDGSISCGGVEGPIGGVGSAAVKITDGGTGPDAIAVQYTSDPNLDTFRYPSKTELNQSMVDATSPLNLVSVSGCTVGGLVLVSNGGSQCTMMQITDLDRDNLILKHDASNNGKGVYNPPLSYMENHAWPAYKKFAEVTCFAPANGTAFFEKGYAVDTTTWQLERTDNSVTPAIVDEPVAPEIIDLQAQYGVSAAGAKAGEQVVSDWVDAKGAEWTEPSVENRKRIKAVRIAIVARSTQYERPPAGGACTTTTADAVKKWPGYDWAKFDTTNYPAEWQCYRYKVYETIVPLRNVIWGEEKT